jgi:hypothetical protein
MKGDLTAFQKEKNLIKMQIAEERTFNFEIFNLPFSFCNLSRLTFHGPGREAGDVMLHEEGIYESDGKRSQNGRGHERPPEQGVGLNQITNRSDWNGFHGTGRHEDKGIEKFIPAEGKAENTGGKETRDGKRQNNAYKDLDTRAAVGHGAFFDFLWDRAKIPHQEPGGKRNQLGGIGENQRPIGVIQTEAGNDLRQGKEEESGGD